VSQDGDSPQLPQSASCFALNLIALMFGLSAVALSAWVSPDDPGRTLLYAVSAVALTIIIGEAWQFRRTRRPSTGLEEHASKPLSLAETGLRCLGLAITLGMIGLAYWLFPEYHGEFYAPYWRFLRLIAWPTLLSAPIYFAWIGQRLTQPKDAYLQLGRLALGRGWRELESTALRAHFAAWTVKAFFLPLMVVYLNNEIGTTVRVFHVLTWQTMRWYQFFYDLSFLIDLLFCVVGYTLTLRLFDSQIRSTEPTFLGWVVALVCYQPFYSVIGTFYLNYESGLYWDTWLAPHPTARTIWALLIVLLLATYALATVSFGLRFSNLTHRGIITNGPYRFTKHPAYLTKNLSWWLISVPFLVQNSWLEAFRHCALLAGLNGIYVLRAWTEERHLSRDPDYVAYCQWVRDHGMFRWFRHLPKPLLTGHRLRDR